MLYNIIVTSKKDQNVSYQELLYKSPWCGDYALAFETSLHKVPTSHKSLHDHYYEVSLTMP